MRPLWLTNDLPPRAGGIEQFVGNLLRRVSPRATLVLGPQAWGAGHHDRQQPYRTVRLPAPVLPTCSVLRAVREHAAEHRAEVVVLGASWPLGELAPYLADDPGVPVVGLTHGLEAGLAGVGLGHLIGRATRGLAAATTISEYTERRLTPHLRAGRVERLSPGVDTSLFHPAVDGARMRLRWGIPTDAPLVGCVSRLVRRKGQDVLLAAWPQVRRVHPDAWLVLVGEGPLAEDLAATVERERLRNVVLADRVDWDDLPSAHAALDLFAMPCRTRLLGTDVEGLGIVYLEAQACGVPVIVGRSGGAPETVREPDTGSVVDGTRAAEVAEAIVSWLDDPPRRAQAAEAGRAWVEERWDWRRIAERLRALLEQVVASGG